MCGICGIYFLRNGKISKDILIKMRDAMIHRGPDDAGYYISSDKKLGLGHRRLKIIDLSDNARQPMHNEDETIWLICNGSIYNHDELRVDLKKNDHTFMSTNDNEVILHLYEEYGIDLLNKLDGDFAFALWDMSKNQLFIARDKLGVKPCYYCQDNGVFMFASEIKSLLQIKNISREIDFVALHHYFSFGSIPAPHTIYKSIRKLLPGHYLKVDEDGIKDKQFWDAANLFIEPLDERNEDIVVEEFASLMKKSIKKRLISDVPLGVFLSGGIDSSVIVALMSEITDNIKTYSVVFGDNHSCDESRYSRMVAQRFKTDHHELLIEDKNFSKLPDIIKYFDEPFAIPSVVPLFFLSKFAGDDIKVALTGDGCDELFAGYERYYWDSIFHRNYMRGLSSYIKPIIHMIRLIPHSLLSVRMNKVMDFAIKRLLSISLHRDIRYVNLLAYFSEDMKHSLYTKEISYLLKKINSVAVLEKYYRILGNCNNLDRRIYGDIMTTLPDEMLTKGDRMTMINSITNRTPFLDQNVVEFSARLPSNYKLRSRIGKYIVKKSYEDILPKEIIYRKKMGFNVPLGHWLRNDLRSLISEYLDEKTIKQENIFDYKQINILVNHFLEKKANYEYQLFPLIVFEMWYKQLTKS